MIKYRMPILGCPGDVDISVSGSGRGNWENHWKVSQGTRPQKRVFVQCHKKTDQRSKRDFGVVTVNCCASENSKVVHWFRFIGFVAVVVIVQFSHYYFLL